LLSAVLFGVADRVRSLRQRLVTLSLLVLGIPALTINALYFARELNRLEESYNQLANSTLRVIAAQYQAGMRSFMQGRQAAIAQSLDWVRLPPTSGPGISVLDLNNGYVASSVGSVIDEASLEEVGRCPDRSAGNLLLSSPGCDLKTGTSGSPDGRIGSRSGSSSGP